MWFAIPLLHSFKYYVVMYIRKFELTAHTIIKVGRISSYGSVSGFFFQTQVCTQLVIKWHIILSRFLITCNSLVVPPCISLHFNFLLACLLFLWIGFLWSWWLWCFFVCLFWGFWLFSLLLFFLKSVLLETWLIY